MTLPALPIALTPHPDGISLVMAGLALFMTLCTALFATGYALSGPRLPLRLFWCGLWGFGLFAVLTVLAADWFSLTIFMELASVALFIMVLPGDRKTAFMYLLTQFAGAGLLLTGTALLYLGRGQVGLGPVPNSILPWFLAGLGIKAALPGLHFWLPPTHSRAPAPASALLSGFAVKMGIYGLMRLACPATENLFLIAGLAMALYGMLQALSQSDVKRLLAFSTISQLGFVLSALGSGSQAGIPAALLYSVSHGLFKGLLFCSAGVLEKTCGTRDLNGLASRAPASPLLLSLFLVGALAIIGFPGTCGFIAKTLVKTAIKAGHRDLATQGLFLAGLGTTLYLCKMGYYGFLGGGKSSGASRRPADPRCLAAMALLAGATLLVGTLPMAFPGLIPGHAGPWLTLSNLLPALLPILGGLTAFALAPALFRPGRRKMPDLYSLLAGCHTPWTTLGNILGNLHNGRLRIYLVILLTFALLVFSLLTLG